MKRGLENGNAIRFEQWGGDLNETCLFLDESEDWGNQTINELNIEFASQIPKWDKILFDYCTVMGITYQTPQWILSNEF